jgi:hypothetical protein
MTTEPRVPPASADDAPDAYLQRALRHAPDADVVAPPRVSAAILREARGAAAQATPAPRRAAHDPLGEVLRALGDAWSWLARPRAAGALASVMVATLAGVLWWNTPPDPDVERFAGAAPTEAPAGAEATPRDAAARAAAQAAAEAAAAPSVAAAPPPAQEAVREQRVGAAARSDGRAAAQAPRAPPPAAAADADAAAPVQAAPPATAPALAKAAPQAAAPAPAPAPAPAAAAEPAPTSALAVPPAAALERSIAPPRPAAPAPEGDRLRSMARVEPRAAVAGPNAPAGALARLREQIAAQPQRWSWRWSDAPARPADAALQAWLARLDAAASAEATAEVTAEATAERAAEIAADRADAAITLELLRDGAPHSTLQLGTASVRFGGAGGAPLRLVLRAEAAAELKAALQPMMR